MNINTSIVTDTSRTVTEAGVNAYRDAIARHIDSDWAAHTQIRVFSTTPYVEPVSLNTATPASVRFLLTYRVGDVDTAAVFFAPATIQPGTWPAAGNAPVVLRDPVGASVRVGELVHMSVYGASATSMLYQWQKNSVNIIGAVNDSFDIPSVKLTDQAVYRVKVTNAVGYTYSAEAQVNVSS
jgi:hypothetical protein